MILAEGRWLSPLVGYLPEILKDNGNMGKIQHKPLDKAGGKWATPVMRSPSSEIL